MKYMNTAVLVKYQQNNARKRKPSACLTFNWGFLKSKLNDSQYTWHLRHKPCHVTFLQQVYEVGLITAHGPFVQRLDARHMSGVCQTGAVTAGGSTWSRGHVFPETRQSWTLLLCVVGQRQGGDRSNPIPPSKQTTTKTEAKTTTRHIQLICVIQSV